MWPRSLCSLPALVCFVSNSPSCASFLCLYSPSLSLFLFLVTRPGPACHIGSNRRLSRPVAFPYKRSLFSSAPVTARLRRRPQSSTGHHSTTCGHPRVPVASIGLFISTASFVSPLLVFQGALGVLSGSPFPYLFSDLRTVFSALNIRLSAHPSVSPMLMPSPFARIFCYSLLSSLRS